MMFLLVPMVIGSMISVIIFMITSKLNMKTKINKKSREQTSPFECGFAPFNSARTPFSLHFFIIAIMFLIFDMEIAILMPIPITMMDLPMKEWGVPFFTFLIILTAGWIHEWNEGTLEWTK